MRAAPKPYKWMWATNIAAAQKHRANHILNSVKYLQQIFPAVPPLPSPTKCRRRRQKAQSVHVIPPTASTLSIEYID